MPDISAERSISIFETFDALAPHDYFASALRVVRRYGCNTNNGYTIEINSTIPINAGVSSSSALVVAWVHFLLSAFGCDQTIKPQFIAQLAYEAEVLEHLGPGGRMDQYTIAIGNIIYIDTSKDSSFKTIGTILDGLILVESGIPKETIGLLSHVRTNATKAIDLINAKNPNFDIKKATLEDYKNYSHDIPNDLVSYFYAAIQNHLITQKALIAFEQKCPDLKIIGELMGEHHNVLKDYLNVSVPQIDDLIGIALNYGAFGAKIVGSGGGGSIAVLASPKQKDIIIKTLIENGAKSAYEVSVSKGTRLI